MNNITVMPPTDLQQITDMLTAASWCKTPEMEIILAQAIKKHLAPVCIFNGNEPTSE